MDSSIGIRHISLKFACAFASLAALGAGSSVHAKDTSTSYTPPTIHPLGSASRPEDVPINYAVTPSGFYSPSCIRHVQNGETVLADGSIRDTDGSVRTPAACNEPHYRFDGTRVEANGASFPAKIRVAPNVLDAEGKVALAFYRNTEPVTSVSTTWKVPPLPTNLSGPRLTYFSEAQLDVLSGVLPAIVRTVLQYNPPAPPTEPKPFWTIYTIATWQFVDPYISEAKRVDVGDTIVGTIKCANEKCSTWRATAEDTTKNIKSYQDYDVKDIGYPALKISQLNGGLLAESRGDPWNPIDTTCDQFPAGPYDFTPIEIKNTKGNTITPSWASYVANPICDFKISTYINPKTKDSDPTTSTISITH